jgi:hypothetical protein
MDLNNLSVEQARDIQVNSANEHHGAYKSNDKTTVAAVTRAFERGFPGEQPLSNIAEQSADSMATEGPADQGAVELQNGLRKDPEFGRAFEANTERAQRNHAILFGDRGEQVAAQFDQRLSEAEKIAAIKMLAKLELE